MTATLQSSDRATTARDSFARAERDELVTTHIGLAALIAKEVSLQVPPQMRADLRGVANIALIEAAQKYRPGPVAFGAYARKRIRGACLDSVRRRHWLNGTANQLDRHVGDARPEQVPSIESRLIDRQVQCVTRDRLRTAIFALPSRLAVIMWMRYFEGRDHEQLAVSLGVNSSRVSQLHAEALQLMRTVLSPADVGLKSAPH